MHNSSMTQTLPLMVALPAMFVRWYCVEMPKRILKAYWEYALSFWEMFAIMFMIKTLFAPWKNIMDPYPKKGFNLQVILETFTLNVTARTIGFLFRAVSIVTGVVVQILCLLISAAWLALWVTYPVLVVLAVPYLVYSLFA